MGIARETVKKGLKSRHPEPLELVDYDRALAPYTGCILGEEKCRRDKCAYYFEKTCMYRPGGERDIKQLKRWKAERYQPTEIVIHYCDACHKLIPYRIWHDFISPGIHN